MQYLLTEEELTALQGRPTIESLEMAGEAIEALRGLVIASTGCIHSETKKLWYCDECPIGRAALGMDQDKTAHFDQKAAEIWRMACSQSREYSK